MGESYWWLLPLMMMALCFFMMRGRKGPMMCGFGRGRADARGLGHSSSATEILDKRYALGDLSTTEYEAKKAVLRNGAAGQTSGTLVSSSQNRGGPRAERRNEDALLSR